MTNNFQKRDIQECLKVLLLGCFVLFGVSCHESKEQPPIPEKTMAEIIVDIQLAETYSIGLHTPQDSNIRVDRFQKNSDSLYRFYSAILKHYRMNFQDFTAAVDWYKEHPSDMDSMMKISIDVLDREKTKLGVSSGTQPIQVDTNYIQPPNLKGTKAGEELFNSKLKIPVLKRVPPEGNKKNKLSEKK